MYDPDCTIRTCFPRPHLDTIEQTPLMQSYKYIGNSNLLWPREGDRHLPGLHPLCERQLFFAPHSIPSFQNNYKPIATTELLFSESTLTMPNSPERFTRRCNRRGGGYSKLENIETAEHV